MKKTTLFRSMAVVLLAAAGCLVANAKAIIPFGQVNQKPWEAKYFYAVSEGEAAPDNWYAADFDDSAWGTIQGPISSSDGLAYFNTERPNEYCRYWVRSHFTLSSVNADHEYYIQFAHDDECTLYLNGVLLLDQSGTANYNTLTLTAEQKALLTTGDNVLAMYVSDSGGGGMYLDMGLYEDDGNFQDIVRQSDVQIAFSNDETYPWFLNGVQACNGNQGKNNTASWLTMSFRSNKTTELKFDWYKYRYYGGVNELQLYVDGAQVNSTTNSSWTTPRVYLKPGEHVVAFRDTVNSAYGSHSGVRNIGLREILPLETAVLTANSLPITFVNEDTYPWTIEDGYIQNGNYGYNNTTSRISTTFTVDKTSKFSFYYRSMRSDGNSGSSSYHRSRFMVNGVEYDYAVDRREFDNKITWGFEPGTYTVEFVDSVWNTNTAYVTQLKDIELSNNWVEVDLATAGTLGYEVLYSPGINVLTDVEFLKISGPMNAADWTDIKNMTNLIALDLSEAEITEIPNQAFDGKGLINSVILPEGITRIGDYAFRGTNIRKISIPSTVLDICQYAFAGTPLQNVWFADNSQIVTIGERAFASCSFLETVDFGSNPVLTTIGRGAFAWCSALTEIQVPNTVTDVWYGAFQSCTALKSIVFSDAMTAINDHVCYGCTSLEQVHLPVALQSINTRSFQNTTSLKAIDIPATVNEIRSQAFDNSGLESVVLPISMQYLYRYAFSNCKSLKYVELPSYLENGVRFGYYDYYYSADGSACYYDYYRHYGYRYNFQNCTALETVVMRAATPPTITEDPFSGASAKSAVTLVVPSFSVVNYKLDTYWYQFGTIQEGDDVDYWKITSPLMLTNNRRMQGKPDIDLYFGGQLTVGGNAPMEVGQFNLYVNESDPGRLLNTCEAMTADQASVRFAVDANKWYFFTPVYDVALSDVTVSNSASYVFRYYDAQNRAANGASGSWKNVDSDKLIGGQGYIFHCNTACEITFPANAAGQARLFGTTDVSRTLTVNEAATTADRSWNYVGNPYPAYYDIYYMDFSAPITVWTGSTYKAYSVADDELVLRPMQSFFVQKPDAVDEIIFHKEGRQLTTDIAHGAAARSNGSDSRFLFNIAMSGSDGAQADETRVVLNEQASMGYEVERDAAKFMSFEAAVPQLYTTDGEGNSYAINERPQQSGVVNLVYYAGQEGFYTIRALRADGSILLLDALTGTTTDLTAGGYTFHTDATPTADASRFSLLLAAKGSTDGISQMAAGTQPADALYDLQGRQTTGTKKGLYIKAGKKVVRQ